MQLDSEIERHRERKRETDGYSDSTEKARVKEQERRGS